MSPASAWSFSSSKTWETSPASESGDVPALAGGDSRGLLTAVLEGVESEVGEPGDVVPRRVYAEHPALIARAVAVWERAVAGVHPRAWREGFAGKSACHARLAAAPDRPY